MEFLSARFSGDTVSRLLPLYLRECERSGNDYSLAAGNTWGDDTQQVFGPAQEIMFFVGFVGFVASQGEASLLSVYRC